MGRHRLTRSVLGGEGSGWLLGEECVRLAERQLDPLFHPPYEQLGFTRDRMIGKHRWVVTRFVEPTS